MTFTETSHQFSVCWFVLFGRRKSLARQLHDVNMIIFVLVMTCARIDEFFFREFLQKKYLNAHGNCERGIGLNIF
jgi:predicted transposase YdaD